MTDVVTHADPSPGDGRRGPRNRRAHRGLRVPGSVPGGSAERTDDDGRPRHRRAPGTAPFVAPTTGATRHRAAHRDVAVAPGPAGDDAPTTPIALPPAAHAPTAQVDPAEAATTHVAATPRVMISVCASRSASRTRSSGAFASSRMSPRRCIARSPSMTAAARRSCSRPNWTVGAWCRHIPVWPATGVVSGSWHRRRAAAAPRSSHSVTGWASRPRRPGVRRDIIWHTR